MENIKNIFDNLIKEISTVRLEQGDLSDVGNELGIILGSYIEENKLGFETEDLISGLKHGISLTKKTHI